MCLRVRCTDKHVKPVGEVHHGFATGYVWQCRDIVDCHGSLTHKLASYDPSTTIHKQISCAVKVGRL